MATFTFSKRKLQDVREAASKVANPEIYFQGLHHGGCLQVLNGDTDEVITNVFCGRRTGYDSLRKHFWASFANRLTGEFLDRVLTADYAIKFSITNVDLDKRGKGTYMLGCEMTR